MIRLFKIIKLHSLSCEKENLKIRGNFKYEFENVNMEFQSKKELLEYKNKIQNETKLQVDFYYEEKI